MTNAQLPMPGRKMNCGPTLEEPCPPLTETEAQSMFGAWAIVSSPLVLGFDLSDSAQMDMHWSTISNRDALAVNQDWAGFPGSKFASSVDTVDFTPCGWGPQPGHSDGSCSWARTMSWYKPLSGQDSRRSTMAVLLMNNGAKESKLGFKWRDVPGMPASTTACRMYDVWARKPLLRGVRADGSGFTTMEAVAPRGTAFVTLSDCA